MRNRLQIKLTLFDLDFDSGRKDFFVNILTINYRSLLHIYCVWGTPKLFYMELFFIHIKLW